MPSSQKSPSSLPKRTNWWGAFVIGLAGTILVTGIAPLAVQSMGAASIPVFLLVSIAGVVLCLCLAELASMMPHRTGGLPAYALESYKSLGPGVARHVSGLSAWSYGLGWFPVAPLNMILAAKYITVLWNVPLGREFTPISAPINLNVLIISIAGLLVLFIPCYRGIRLGARFATVLGIVSMVPLTLLIFLPFLRPATLHWSNIAGFHLADPKTATFVFFISWIFILSWSVLGTEAAACYIGECRDSARDAKIALSASGLYGSLVYVAIPLLLVGVLGRSDVDPLTAFLAYTEAIFGSQGWVKWVIGIPLVVALLLSVLNAIMGCGRSLYQVAQDGVIPKFFQHTNAHGVPDFAMFFNLVASIIVVFLGSPLEIYIFSNMGYLLALALAYIGYFLYRQNYPALPRPVRMPGFLRYVALMVGVFFLFVWAYGGYYSSDIAVGPGKHWLFFWGLGICFLYLPLHAYRRLVEDRRAAKEEFPAGVDVAPSEADS